MTSDPLRRLESGLAEDERIARAATELPKPITRWPEKRPPWEPERWIVGPFGDVETVNGVANPIHDLEGGPRSDAVAHHIARFDPHREFAEVALKRLILDRHKPWETRVRVPDGAEITICLECSPPGCDPDEYDEWPCDYVKALQAIYPEDTQTEGVEQ